MSLSKIRIAGLAAGLFLLGGNAFSQTYYAPFASLADIPAPPGASISQTGVLHTGTDVARDDKSNRVQAMVWDNTDGGGSVYFSWAVNNTLAIAKKILITPPSGTTLSDPDVVMAPVGSTLYADVVYLATDASGKARTYWDVYVWNSTTRVFARKSGFTPVPLGATVRSHVSPNIDANKSGTASIVWDEYASETVTYSVTSPSINPAYVFTQPGLAFGDVYVLPVNIDGTPATACGSYRGVVISVDPTDPVAPPLLFNRYLNPDVAVGPTGITSVAYIHNSNDISGNNTSSLEVKQVTFDGCNINLQVDKKAWVGSGGGTPRIAATSNSAAIKVKDIEIVLDWSSTPCEEGFGPRSYQAIYNYGKNDNAFRKDPTVVSMPVVVGVNSLPATQPVVSYYSGTAQDQYIVAWTGYNYDVAGGTGLLNDVWARSLTNGTLIYPYYSRVNLGPDEDPTIPPAGNQQVPSVAARYSLVPLSSVHLFADDAQSLVFYKNVTVAAGDKSLARVAGGTKTGDTTTDPAQPLEAFPNPSSAAVDFNLHLREGEVVQQLTVVDLMGRVLDKIAVPASKSTEQKLTWQPKQAVPAGSYVVKLVTNQRTENITLNRNR